MTAYDAMAGPLRRHSWAEMAGMAGPRWLGRDGSRRDSWAITTRWLGHDGHRANAVDGDTESVNPSLHTMTKFCGEV